MTQPIIRMISRVAPVAPKCFASRDQWVVYLESAQQCKSNRPFSGERYVPRFNFCAECPRPHRAEMERARRCEPKAYIARRIAEARPPVFDWRVPLMFARTRFA